VLSAEKIKLAGGQRRTKTQEFKNNTTPGHRVQLCTAGRDVAVTSQALAANDVETPQRHPSQVTVQTHTQIHHCASFIPHE